MDESLAPSDEDMRRIKGMIDRDQDAGNGGRSNSGKRSVVRSLGGRSNSGKRSVVWALGGRSNSGKRSVVRALGGAIGGLAE